MQQPATLRSRQHRDRPRRSRRAQICPFQRIDRNIDLRNLRTIRKLRPHVFADVKHRCLIAFAFADHNRAVHGNAVHGAAHGFGG